MTRRVYWGLGVLVILIIGAGCVLLLWDTGPKLLKKPPPGETYATGHYEGNKWRRRVPPDPETIFIDSKELVYGVQGGDFTYEELEEKYKFGDSKNRRVFGKYIIEKYPYSGLALTERLQLAENDENSKEFIKTIYDPSILLPRYKEMMRYHRDSPRLLFKMARLLEDDSLAESIKYGEEALKYLHLYPYNSWYGFGLHPEEIHGMLGFAYESVGGRNNMIGLLHQSVENYKSALVHFKAAVKLVESNPGRWRDSADIYLWYIKLIEKRIKRIEAGELLFGPPTSE